MNSNYLATLDKIAKALDEIKQPLNSEQSKAIAAALHAADDGAVLAIVRERNGLADVADALHTGYRAPVRKAKGCPERSGFTTNAAYNKACDRWAENQQ